ncbi:MAG: hypothetical protein JST48_04870 [Bacteroidetes bacterium]|nr:hypothetical protein [Bacteroidota bacterium]
METRAEILKRINWDYNYSTEEIDSFIKGKNFLEKKPFLIKILMFVSWYNILKTFSTHEIKEILSEEVVDNLHIDSLRKKYTYARHLLFG